MFCTFSHPLNYASLSVCMKSVSSSSRWVPSIQFNSLNPHRNSSRILVNNSQQIQDPSEGSLPPPPPLPHPPPLTQIQLFQLTLFQLLTPPITSSPRSPNEYLKENPGTSILSAEIITQQSTLNKAPTPTPAPHYLLHTTYYHNARRNNGKKTERKTITIHPYSTHEIALHWCSTWSKCKAIHAILHSTNP